MSENLPGMPEDLLVKYLLREASPEETRWVETWMGESPANRKYYEHFVLIWQQSRDLSKGYVIDEEAAWQKFRNRIRETPGAQETAQIRSMPSLIRPLSSRPWIRIAALFLLIAIAGGLTWLFFGSSATQTLSSLERTATGTLPDGSVVTLNKHSTISYHHNLRGENRTIELQGEAFFKVSPDKNRPFFVHTNGITIKVLGTSFNVRNREKKTGVIVETGLVQVSNRYGAILAGPHEEITLDENDHLIKRSVANELYKFYRTREFVCDNIPLGEFVAVLNDAYNAHIVIGKPALRGLRITTVFHDEPLDNILSVIGLTFKITVTKKDSQIILQ